jgi:aminopeptidase N
MSKSVPRLSAGFWPEHYEIELTPNRDDMSLHGRVVVTGQKLGRPSQRLTFHQHGLRITAASILVKDKKGEREIPVERINHHESFDEVRLHSEELLYPGKYTVTMTFEGKVQDTLHGVYRANYEVNGQKQTLVTTQFESHFARQAFPCIDEPAAKAVFELTLLTPNDDQTLSNTPIAKQSKENSLTKTTFEPTPKMSTYLLAFVSGDLQSKKGKTKDGVEVGIWATKAHTPESLDFALDVATRSIEFFNEYYGVPYPLAKCDHVAVPDFAVGAMENWGLITFRESCLLADPATTSQSGRERIAMVVAHELSHQWFGDLVTMQWWDDLWLNESFANVMEYVAVDALFPDWHLWDSFAAGEGLSAIRRDCIYGVQAIKTTVNHPDEISTLFDPSIVYAKGGRLLNMLKHFIGEDDFRKGLKAYFEQHAYGNTTGDDLWNALSKASGKDIGTFMKPWLERPGFPLVRVEQNGKDVTLSQSHFLLDDAKHDAERLWPVPLFASDKALPSLFEAATLNVTLASNDFVCIDQGALGHYIVQYVSPEHAAAMAELAAAKKLSAVERLMLLSDSSLLARAGKHSFAETLKLIGHYAEENSEPVWDIIALTIGESKRFIDIEPEVEVRIKAFIRELIEPEYQRLGWKEKADESAADTKLRATIIGLGAYAEHRAILDEATHLFEAYKKDTSAVPSELRSIVFSVAVRWHVEGAFDYLLKLDEKTSNSSLKQDLLGALVSTIEPKEIKTLLGRLQDADKVRPQDFDYWLVFLLRSRYAHSDAWQWFRDNWAWIETTFSGDQTYDIFPRYAASAFSTFDGLQSYKNFFEPKKNQTALARNIDMGIEEISNRAAWLERDRKAVLTFFETYK